MLRTEHATSNNKLFQKNGRAKYILAFHLVITLSPNKDNHAFQLK